MSTATAISKMPLPVKVRVVSGPHVNESFTFTSAQFTIGRGAENNLVFPNDPKISRNHLKVLCEGNNVTIENLSSKNPMYVKGNYEQRAELRPGDIIRVGETDLEFSWDGDPGEKTLAVGANTIAELKFEKTAGGDTNSRESIDLLATSDEKHPVEAPPVPSLGIPDFSTLYEAKKSSNLKPSVFSPNSKAVVPEVRYTPTSAGGAVKVTTSSTHSGTGRKSLRAPDSLNRILVFGALAVILIIVIVIGSTDSKKGKKSIALKDTDQIKNELNKTNQIIEQYSKEKHLLEDGRIDRQYESAQSYYIKGFRDYRLGQYARAITSFQAALSFDPNHLLAQRYLSQSIKKHAEVIQFNLDQARRYRQKNNFRRCRASAQQVMVLRKDQNDPQYKTAKELFEECETLARGRY